MTALGRDCGRMRQQHFLALRGEDQEAWRRLKVEIGRDVDIRGVDRDLHSQEGK